MYFDEDFIKSLPEEPFKAIEKICHFCFPILNRLKPTPDKCYDFVVEIFAFLGIYGQENPIVLNLPSLPTRQDDFYDMTVKFLSKLQGKVKSEIGKANYEVYKKAFGIQLGKVFHYEFSDGDLERIQALTNELRELISGTEELSEEHKQRLLKRLEKFQAELHKKISDLDRFWGILFDFSTVVGLMGENAKPMVGVIKEIVGIIWPAQARAYGLASNLPFKLLGETDDEKAEDDKTGDKKT